MPTCDLCTCAGVKVSLILVNLVGGGVKKTAEGATRVKGSMFVGVWGVVNDDSFLVAVLRSIQGV